MDGEREEHDLKRLQEDDVGNEDITDISRFNGRREDMEAFFDMEDVKREEHCVPKLHRTVESFYAMGIQDIMKESTTLLRANSSLLMSIMAIFICPASGIILSHVLVDGTLVHRLSSRFENVIIAGGLQRGSFSNALCLKLSETLVSYTLCFPVFMTLWLLAKGAVTYSVACSYAGKRASIQKFLFVAPKIWKRIFFTNVWISLAVLVSTSAVVLFFLLVAGLLDAMDVSGTLVLVVEVIIGVTYSVIFAHLIVISNLANVVSVLEEYSGGAALLRSLFLIKGRAQVALMLFLLTTLSMAMVETLFQYRVRGIPENSYKADYGSRLWEAPLLISMYSFLYLFDAIMSSVFYFTCKSAYIGSSDINWMLEQVSFSLDLIN